METKGNKRKLTKKQIELAYMLADPECEYCTIGEMCAAVGVVRSTYYRYWLKNENFISFVNELIEKHTSAELGPVWRSLIRKCHSGDTQAIKLFFELKGKYKQQVDVSGGVVFMAGEEDLEG